MWNTTHHTRCTKTAIRFTAWTGRDWMTYMESRRCLEEGCNSSLKCWQTLPLTPPVLPCTLVPWWVLGEDTAARWSGFSWSMCQTCLTRLGSVQAWRQNWSSNPKKTKQKKSSKCCAVWPMEQQEQELSCYGNLCSQVAKAHKVSGLIFLYLW